MRRGLVAGQQRFIVALDIRGAVIAKPLSASTSGAEATATKSSKPALTRSDEISATAGQGQTEHEWCLGRPRGVRCRR